MKRDSMEFKQRIFDLMNGTRDENECLVRETVVVENEFADGKLCGRLYEEVYEAGRRLCERLGVEEDPDVEIIIENLMKIGEHQAMKMYDYGRMFL